MKKLGEYKKTHIAFATWVVFFKIMVVASIIYVGYNMGELQKELELTRESQAQIETQVSENQASIQSQINEISTSLLETKNNLQNTQQLLNNEISELKAQTSSDFSEIIENVIPAVVSVGTDISQGSGFLITADGYIITNSHVLENANLIRVLNYNSQTWQTASLIGYDPILDIAIIKISGSGYDYLEFGDSENVKVGEKAIALGNPLGLSFSVSEGIISGLDRIGPNNIEAYIQVDASLNPGNSGGPLVNKNGEVIGINNFKLQNAENLGFALESNHARETINNIFEVGNIDKNI